MSLASALSTALTGLNSAETTISVVGNNLANSSTDGFKASTALFATQFLQTENLGSGPQGLSGGTDPTQIGLGTQVASITPDFSQGTIQLSSSPSDLAIQGNGFFIAQAATGEQLYTRDGAFQTNSQNQLVTSTGNKLLGYGVDNNFQLQTNSLSPLSIPLGSTAVAQATQNVFLQGTLTPTGTIANTAEILQSAVLGDGQFAAPTATTQVHAALPPDLTGATASGSGAGTINGDYTYKIVYVDADGNEGPASTLTVTANNASEIDLSNLPTDSNGNYVARNIYRSAAGENTTFNLVGTINDNTTTTFTDTTADSSLSSLAAYNPQTINGNYTYYVTWSAPGVPESRPSGPLGPVNIADGNVLLSDLPGPTGVYNVAGAKINVYRNVTGQPDTFYRVAEVDPSTDPQLSYLDNIADSTITNNNLVSNPIYATLDLDGPKITGNTVLVNVLNRNGNTYANLFQPGELSFTGEQNGSNLSPKTLQITNTTTVQDLISFMTDALGIQTPGDDSANPIPNDVTGQPPGGSVLTDGRIQLVGNNGADNSISIPLSAFKLTPTGSTNASTPLMGFSSVQSAAGQSASTSFQVFDSLGIPLTVNLTSVLQSSDSTGTTYRWFANSPDNDPTSGSSTVVGTGLINFDGEGNVVSVSNSTVSIERQHVASVSPLQFNLDFSEVSGLASSSSSLAAARQDGSGAGTLTSYNISGDGTINGVFSNGVTRTLGQIVLASFANPEGLQAKGDNDYATGVNSGLPVINKPGTGGAGSITAGAVELSNTDIGQSLINLILASTDYRGNAQVITTVNDMLQQLLTLNR
ncbi:MAG TPA: flagellar hook-basal body complex protein [Pirellulales bacterium]|jgi:flagellar hook protein FlgE|nr:flagellar hook-basal body complex protein [Pirellulales bacterium]